MQYISNEKEGWGQQTCDQLEGVKPIHSFPTFQNEEVAVVDDSLTKKRVHVQTRPKGCLCFGFAPAPYFFTKLLKIPIVLLKRIGICVVIYLEYMLIIGRTREETIALRNTVILLLQCLGFAINHKKSVMAPVQERKLLGMIVSSKGRTISLPQEKLKSIKDVSGSVSESTDSFKVDKGVTSPDINNFSHSSSKTPLSFSPTATNLGTEEKCLLRKFIVTEQESQFEFLLVDEKHRVIQ